MTKLITAEIDPSEDRNTVFQANISSHNHINNTQHQGRLDLLYHHDHDMKLLA